MNKRVIVQDTSKLKQTAAVVLSLLMLFFFVLLQKYPTVEVNSCVYDTDTWCISDKLKEEIAKSVHNINMLDPVSKVCNRITLSFCN
jgi:hypothetical protein